MHSAALHLLPILAAEKSKVAFYVAGAVLVAWALIVSLGLGLRRPDFPGSLQLERATIAVTVVLVLAAVTTAVITSGSAAKAGETSTTTSAAGATQTSAAPTSTAPTPTQSTATTPAEQKATTPKATTGAPTPAPAPPATVTSLALAADPGGMLAYDTKTLSAKAGTVTITLKNNAPLEHDVTIAQASTVLGKTPTFRAGSRNVTVKLSRGTYTFYCSVPGHRQAGMEGTLNVS